jgi:SAM-dependent methyltransferase
VSLGLSEPFRELYSSHDFVDSIEADWMPWLLDGVDLGDDVVGLVAGPGPTVPLLRAPGRRVTAAQAVPALTAPLAERFAGDPDVDVVDADPLTLPFPNGWFSAATAVLWLHHVPSADEQNRALAEVLRVLRPGGVLAGLNPLDGPHFRRLDTDGSCAPIDPLTFADRLRRAGFVDVSVTVWSFVRFIARAPEAAR